MFDLASTEILHERDLERGPVDHVGPFLLEHGQGFAFVGRQVRLEVGGEDCRCDLLLHHLEPRRYVVIELEAVDFDPSFLGQLGLSTAAVDELLSTPEDGDTIGLLLCRSRNAVVAELSDPVDPAESSGGSPSGGWRGQAAGPWPSRGQGPNSLT